MAASSLPQRCPACVDDPREFLAPKRNNQIVDITGRQFNRLTPEHFLGMSKRRAAYWCCLCLCGNHRIILGASIRSGASPSCGCLTKEHQLAMCLTHGMTHSPEYQSWSHMRSRCTNPLDDRYSDYAGRGITVCIEWLESFETFYADMGPRPCGTSIERRDNMLGYYKENCYWATATEQQNNMRLNRFITWQGETLSIAEWSRRTGIPRNRLTKRLDTGWSMARVFSYAHLKPGPKPSMERL